MEWLCFGSFSELTAWAESQGADIVGENAGLVISVPAGTVIWGHKVVEMTSYHVTFPDADNAVAGYRLATYRDQWLKFISLDELILWASRNGAKVYGDGSGLVVHVQEGTELPFRRAADEWFWVRFPYHRELE